MADENSKPLNIGDKVIYQPIGERRIATTITGIGSKGDPEEPGEERTVYDTASGSWGYRDQFTTAPTFMGDNTPKDKPTAPTNEPKLRGDHTYEATEKVVGVKLPAIQKAALRYAFGTNGGKIKADGSLEVSGVSKINASTNPQQWGERKREYAQIAVGSTHTAHLVSVDEIYRPRGSGLGRTAVIVFTENRN